MNGSEPPVKLFGTRGSAEARAIRDFLHRCNVSCQWIELNNDHDAQSEAQVAGLNDKRLPVCIFADGTRMEHPTMRQVSEKLGLFQSPSHSQYDLSIYGAGPAGLSAAVYGASEGLKTVVIERFAVGGQAGASPKIENYLGFPGGIAGAELALRARDQACRFGAEILLLREKVRGEFLPGKGIGYLSDGTKIIARASICATGVEYRRLNLPNEDKFRDAGLYYGAGASEASLCNASDRVFVVGGGNSGAQAAMHFARYTTKVTMVVRENSLKKSVSQYLVDRILSCPRINVLLLTEVIALHGDEILRAITLCDKQTGKEWTEETNWLFLCLGGVPHTRWAAEVGIIRDEAGYLITGPDLMKNGARPDNWKLDRDPYYLETNLPGVFAAGDVRHGSVKRCASAVGEGAMAVMFVHRYIASG
ncbi:MAG TPA: FAD-dependent oxidoreductase [Candidatus Sulfotelmatobacter sp.]|jgi:thioredoxin reductase (NADPH)|nr:FAD-dependent oxidoreductase [Candidatus Sulfotelmatobacter sp.]